MGHVRNYSIGDVIARYKAARGFNVMHPMGWDAFGLPAENAAIKHKTHPAKWTYSNVAKMRQQFERLGCLFDWRREVTTCSPEYYRWEQLFFTKMFERGLAYRKLSTVNWCPSCNTVLANEQVEQGLCWRCDSQVTTKELNQWFLKITQYAESLLSELDKMPGWPDNIKAMQRYWIGKSQGAEVAFKVTEPSLKETEIKVFTTRVDTIGGVSFLSIAPEHPLTMIFAKASGKEKEVSAFVESVRKMDRIKRTAENLEKEGVSLGVQVKNPVTGKDVPVYTANFVLMEYGTGAVMAVPAHDERDHAFAKKYNLPIEQVIVPASGYGKEVNVLEKAFTEHGILQKTGEFSGLTSEEALVKIPAKLT
jgi:leucyl-tRNA synthetase